MADYISRGAFIEAVKDIPMWGSVAAMLADSIPAADVIEVVRCKDCELSRDLTKAEKRIWLNKCHVCENPEAPQSGYMIVFPEDYCSLGKRRGNDG